MDFVFVGKVVRVDRLPIGRLDTVEFQVNEAFRGRLGTSTTVRVHTLRCPPYIFLDRFEENQSYLVYASKHPGQAEPYVSVCNRVVPVNDANDDIKYWRNLDRISETSAVVGTAKQYIKRNQDVLIHVFKEDRLYQMRPLADQTITIQGATGTHNVRTDDAGRYELKGMRPGNYVVSMDVPMHPELHAEKKVSLVSKACAEVDFRQTLTGDVVVVESGVQPTTLSVP